MQMLWQSLNDNKKPKFLLQKIKSRLNVGDACYHTVKNLLSSSLLSETIKIKIYKIIILSVVFVIVKLSP
jgi:hypothetical protein